MSEKPIKKTKQVKLSRDLGAVVVDVSETEISEKQKDGYLEDLKKEELKKTSPTYSATKPNGEVAKEITIPSKELLEALSIDEKKELLKQIEASDSSKLSQQIVKVPERDSLVFKSLKDSNKIKVSYVPIAEIPCDVRAAKDMSQDPLFMQKIAEEAFVKNLEANADALGSGLRAKQQYLKVAAKEEELREVRNNNPLSKVVSSNSYRKAKGEYYYNIIHKIVSTRIQILEEVTAKYGKEVAEGLMFFMRGEIQDIWMDDSIRTVEIAEKQRELANEQHQLKLTSNALGKALDGIPRVSAEDVVPKNDLFPAGENCEEIDLGMDLEDDVFNIDPIVPIREVKQDN